jgi:HPt (histidine-containing phosphotransfer) domain-containing protein
VQIERARDARDLAGIARAAHDLKSTSGNFGARQLCALAHRLEAAAKADKADEVRLLASLVRPANYLANAALKRRFARAL